MVAADDPERVLSQAPRVHFAINCASVSCPPLASEPYRSDRLEAQLDRAASAYSELGALGWLRALQEARALSLTPRA